MTPLIAALSVATGFVAAIVILLFGFRMGYEAACTDLQTQAPKGAITCHVP